MDSLRLAQSRLSAHHEWERKVSNYCRIQLLIIVLKSDPSTLSCPLFVRFYARLDYSELINLISKSTRTRAIK